MQVPRPHRLSYQQLALFSLPMVAVQAIEIPWRTYLPALLTETVGLGLATVGALLMAIRMLDMVIDPIIGWASDRVPTRFGLRRPWMVAGVPLIMLGAWRVFLAAPGAGLTDIAVGCVILHVGYTLMVTPYGGWSLELARDHDERARVTLARTWIAVAGAPVLTFVPSLLERGFGAGLGQQVGAMGVLVILLAPLCVGLVVRNFAELPVNSAATARTATPLRQFIGILRDPALKPIVVMYALAGLTEASTSGCFLFFVDQAVGFKGWGSTLLLLQAVVMLAALPLWSRVSRSLDTPRTLFAAFAWQATSLSLAFLIPAGSWWPLSGFVVLRGAGSGADFMLLRTMVAEASGRDALNGVRRSGSYYSLFNVTLRLSMSLGASGVLWLLATGGFSPGLTANEPMQETIRLVYALPGCLCAVTGMLLTWRSVLKVGTARCPTSATLRENPL